MLSSFELESRQGKLDKLARKLADADAFCARERFDSRFGFRFNVAPQQMLFNDLLLFPVPHTYILYGIARTCPQTYPQPWGKAREANLRV